MLVGLPTQGRSVAGVGNTPLGAGLPGYASGLSIYDAKSLSGVDGPADGNVTLEDLLLSLSPPLNDWASNNNDPGTTGPRSIIDAWCGGAADHGNGRLFLLGGGHDNSANNGVYRFDFSDDGEGLPVGWTLLPNTLSDIADVPTTSGSHPTYNDGLPGSIHSYDCLAFDAVRQRFIRIGGASWKSGADSIYAGYYDLATESWTTITADTADRIVNALDPSTGKILHGDSAGTDLYFSRPDGTLSDAINVGQIPSGNSIFSLDTSRNRAFFFGGGEQQYWEVDWSAETVTNQTYTASGATSILSDTGFGAVFDTGADCFWMLNDPFDTLYRMDANDFSITSHAITGDNIVDFKTGSPFTFKRLALFKGLLCTVTNWDEPAFAIRVT